MSILCFVLVQCCLYYIFAIICIFTNTWLYNLTWPSWGYCFTKNGLEASGPVNGPLWTPLDRVKSFVPNAVDDLPGDNETYSVHVFLTKSLHDTVSGILWGHPPPSSGFPSPMVSNIMLLQFRWCGDAVDLRRHRAHDDVTVLTVFFFVGTALSTLVQVFIFFLNWGAEAITSIDLC